MNKKQFFLACKIFLILMLTGCTSSNISTDELIPPENGVYETTPDPLLGTVEWPLAVLMAVEELSQETAIPTTEIEVVSYKRVEWSTACLGFPEPGEMCAQVITPGWLIILKARGENFEFHTDQDGSDIRWRSQFDLT